MNYTAVTYLTKFENSFIKYLSENSQICRNWRFGDKLEKAIWTMLLKRISKKILAKTMRLFWKVCIMAL